MNKPIVNPEHPWAKTSNLMKRLNGFASYQLAAFVSLISPVAVDRAMYSTLKEQFVEQPQGGGDGQEVQI